MKGKRGRKKSDGGKEVKDREGKKRKKKEGVSDEEGGRR